MEFGYTERQEQIRKEAREFFTNELPADFDEYHVRQGEAIEKFWDDFQQKAVQRRYPSANWPKKYDGLGLSGLESGIISEEMAYWGIRWPGALSYSLCGPVIITVGTDEQKARFVPPIARGEVTCFEAYTEPNAGSDEANMELRAVQDGDFWVMNGQKTFISGMKRPDWLFTLARTAETLPKHRGITLFMVDGHSPGVTYRCLETMAGSRQHEIFYDNVRVPKNNVIGEVNRGFYAAMATFEFERASVAIGPRRGMQRLVEYCRKEKRNGQPLIKDPKVRAYLAKVAMHQHVMNLVSWAAIWRSSNREKVGSSKYDLTMFLNKDWIPNRMNGFMEILDMYGQLESESKYVQYGGEVGRLWESSRMIHPAGTPEILKVVLANRGLGLPRIPRKFNAMIAAELGKE